MQIFDNLGLLVSQVKSDKQIHRVPTQDKPHSKNGWYIAVEHNGDMYITAGNWRTGEQQKETTANGGAKWGAVELQVNLDRQLANQKCANKAQKLVPTLPPATADHLYAKNKSIDPTTALLYNGNLLIPIYNNKRLAGYQTIAPNGKKLFSKGVNMSGSYHIIGDGVPIYLTEGYATGCTIHKATGKAVVVAFNASNLPKCKHLASIVCADNDPTGLQYAKQTGLTVKIPPKKGDDFNDMGVEATKEVLQPPMVFNITTPIPEGHSELISLGLQAMTKSGMPNIEQYTYPAVVSIIANAIAGRVTCQEVHPNLFNIKIGGTSSGKTETDKEFKKMLPRDYVGITDIASGPALLRALDSTPQTLMMVDEVTSMFRNNKDPVQISKRDTLMEAYSASGGLIKKSYANSKDSITADRVVVSMLGNCTMDIFSALSMEDFKSGLIPRMDFWCYDGKVPYRGLRQEKDTRFTDAIQRIWQPNIVEPVDLPLTDRAAARLSMHSRNTIDGVNHNKDVYTGVTSRSYDLAIKYAIIHAVQVPSLTTNGMPTIIRLENIEYGIQVAKLIVKWKTDVLAKHIVTGDFHADCKTFLEAIEHSTQRPTFKHLANRRPQLKNWKLTHSREVINVLQKRGEIRICEEGKTAYYKA